MQTFVQKLIVVLFLFIATSYDVVVACEHENNPRVGVAVLIVQDGKILLGLRKNSHGDGTWGTPGGHLEYGESFEQCAIREVAEEIGLEVSNVKLYAITNDVFEEDQKHYVTIFMITEDCVGDVQLLEPEKCEYWAWFDTNGMPEDLFLPLKNLLTALQQE